jgi:hypothetical protein
VGRRRSRAHRRCQTCPPTRGFDRVHAEITRNGRPLVSNAKGRNAASLIFRLPVANRPACDIVGVPLVRPRQTHPAGRRVWLVLRSAPSSVSTILRRSSVASEERPGHRNPSPPTKFSGTIREIAIELRFLFFSSSVSLRSLARASLHVLLGYSRLLGWELDSLRLLQGLLWLLPRLAKTPFHVNVVLADGCNTRLPLLKLVIADDVQVQLSVPYGLQTRAPPVALAELFSIERTPPSIGTHLLFTLESGA